VNAADRKRPEQGEVVQQQQTVPLLEEHAEIVRSVVETGRVRVQLHTEFEPAQVQAELRSEAVSVERVAIGRTIPEGEAPPMPREEEGGAVLIVPVLEEVLVVEKRLVLREEIHLRRRTTSESVTEDLTLRRQTAEVERLPPAPSHRTATTTEEPSR